jgi:iron complex outermembrane recepter protein
VLFKPTEAFSARLTSFSQRIDSNGNGAVDVVGAARTPRTPPANRFDLVDGYTQPRLNEAIVDNVIQTYQLDLSWDLGWAELQSLTSHGRLKTYFTSDITSQNAAPGLTNGQAFAPLWPVPISIRQQQTEKLEKFNQELRLTSKPGKVEWQGGLFYSTEDTVFDQFYFPYNVSNRQPATGGPTIGGSTQPVAYEERAIFADVTYNFTSNLDLSVGLRHTESEQESTSTLFPGLLYSRFSATTSRVKDTDTTYAISPRWKINDDTMIYARVASGFRPGGPLYAAPPAPQFYNSDKTVNYEIGARASFFDDRLRADVAAYRIDWTDIQILTRVTINNITYSTTGNAGKAESNGFEWSFQYRPIQGLTFGLVGAYTDATLSESAPRLGGLAGDQLAYVPEWSNTLNVDYERDLTAGFTGFLGATYSYVGERFTDFSTTATTTNHDKLPEYSQLNLRAGVRNDRYTVQLYLNNATDEIGIVHYNNSGGANQTGSANITTPRTVGLLLQARY